MAYMYAGGYCLSVMSVRVEARRGRVEREGTAVYYYFGPCLQGDRQVVRQKGAYFPCYFVRPPQKVVPTFSVARDADMFQIFLSDGEQ